jgi:hypothetical protein
VGELLHRGLISTTVFRTLIQVEPRTPRATFTWRGPGSFEKGVQGQLVFRYAGTQYLPYPEGYKFPAPDLNLRHHIVIGPDSVLWPFLRHQAMLVTGHQWLTKSGEARLVSSQEQEFSYRFSIPAGRGKPEFEYTNFTIGGTFRLECLTWLNYLNSRTSAAAPGDYDTITFTALGSWSKDPTNRIHIASVQICTSAEWPYASVLIDGGLTSNVNTRPVQIQNSMP